MEKNVVDFEVIYALIVFIEAFWVWDTVLQSEIEEFEMFISENPGFHG